MSTTRKLVMGNPLLTVSFVLVVVVVVVMLLNTSITHTAFAQQKTLRLGYLPNINHAQGVIGIGDGSFQKTLGDNVTLETFVFNADPQQSNLYLREDLMQRISGQILRSMDT
jgi:ABC-type nitrate/sulfonate/bicarbonate transport system substrate-binding protein